MATTRAKGSASLSTAVSTTLSPISPPSASRTCTGTPCTVTVSPARITPASSGTASFTYSSRICTHFPAFSLYLSSTPSLAYTFPLSPVFKNSCPSFGLSGSVSPVGTPS